MSSVSDAQKALGELFIIGFEGPQLPDDTSAFLSQASIGGVILFKQNYRDVEQLVELTHQIQDSRNDRPLWISVDQEGGRVQRFGAPFTLIPPAAAIGAKDSPKLVFELAEVMAKELAACGVNLNFCPVADINTNANNPVIGDRAYGSTEDIVSKNVTAMVRGHVINGVQACVKHFPGHGDTSVDSHLELPKVERSWDDLRDRELRPFVKAFKSRCSMVMVAHILNPQLDPKYPASLSKTTLRDRLRDELRYSKLIVSDDLEMKAITDHFGAAEVPVLAINAGIDILIYRSEAAGRSAYMAASKAIEEGRIDPAIVLDAAERIREVKDDTFGDWEPAHPSDAKAVVGCEEHQEVLKRFAE